MGNLERAKNITTMEKLVQGTVQNANGTSVDFTGIPSWAKKITVMFNGVSTNSTSLTIIQLITSGGATTSGYFGSVGSSLTNGLPTSGNASSSEARYGATSIINLSGNSWVASAAYGISGGAAGYGGGGSVTLSSALTGVRITTVNGTDTFDAGQINILVEG